MIQFRHDRARQLPPIPISYSAATAIRRGQGRTPGIPGGRFSGVAYPALLRDIERALIVHDIAPTRFGAEAANDRTLVHRLRKGACITPAMRDKLLAYIHVLDCGEA
jgi:hypothetical protein